MSDSEEARAVIPNVRRIIRAERLCADLGHKGDTLAALEQAKAMRGCLLWLLWHHQGGSSPVGQPIRRALGIGQHERMTEAQVLEGQAFGTEPARMG